MLKLLAALDALPRGDGRRPPRRIDLGPPLEPGIETELARHIGELADPETPIAAPAFGAEMFARQPAQRALARTGKLVLAAIAIPPPSSRCGAFSPAAGLTDPAALVARLEALGGGPLAPLIVVAAFVLGGLVVFPVTVLIRGHGHECFVPPPSRSRWRPAGVLLSAGR